MNILLVGTKGPLPAPKLDSWATFPMGEGKEYQVFFSPLERRGSLRSIGKRGSFLTTGLD
jgi:hypothetical protein